MILNSTKKPLKSYFEDYINECEYIKRLRPATIASYKEVFNNFQNYLPEIQYLEDLIPSLVTKFFFRKPDQGTLKISSLRTYYNKLCAFFNWLETYDHIPRGSLTKKIPKPPNPNYEDEKALSESQISQIESSIITNRINQPFLRKRDQLILNILIYTGVRRGELLGIRVCDIDFENRTLHIQGSSSKSKKSRILPINPTLFMHIRDYITIRNDKKIQSEFLLVSPNTLKPYTIHGLKFWVKHYKSCSGVKFHLHQFRHTFACALAKSNADITSIKSLLGHSSLSMTERYLRSITALSARSFVDDLKF